MDKMNDEIRTVEEVVEELMERAETPVDITDEVNEEKMTKVEGEYGADEILDVSRGTLRVKPETIVCDLYRFLEGDRDAVEAYRGEYMNAYPWANMTESLRTWRKQGR